MNIDLYLKKKREAVDTFLTSYLNSKRHSKDCPDRLQKAMAYSLMAGGKRIRPILAIASYEAIGGRSKGIVPVASSLELIHTYSLIHDDLPAMDNDDIRRNKPTNHRVFGEATAILAGDALLTEAFDIILKTRFDEGVKVNILRELTSACGPAGMVGGQLMDIILEGKKAKRDEIVYIHTHKTGAFIRASVRIGAIMAGASPEKLKALTIYGDKIGHAFQIVDDILDVTGKIEEMGKMVGADAKKGKNTYPSVFGLEESDRIARRLVDESINAIGLLDRRAEPLREIARYILERRS
ncbi:MAG: polyprenyl synthetase family protein [Thermodesulfovibrionia bacterium]